MIKQRKDISKGKGKLFTTERGITLIVLVIIIAVILILAGVTIFVLLKENERLRNEIDSNESSENNTAVLIQEPISEESENTNTLSNVIKAGEVATAERNKYESDGKVAIIPEGFRVSDKTGETSINGGLVVYAPDDSEYVWIPVDGIIGEEGKTVQNAIDGEIILGRYVFDENGNIDTELTPTTLEGQLKTSSSSSYYYTEDTTGNGNTVATDINAFIQSVKENHGYYIGRYEAGVTGYDESNVVTSNSNNEASWTGYREKSSGSLKLVSKSGVQPWNYITQPKASELCQEIYSGVNSDLVNSYAWDTAILFIQQKGQENNSATYSIQNGFSTTPLKESLTGEGILANTNSVDKQCNIYDMAGNCFEWSTETHVIPSFPCATWRGGSCYNNESIDCTSLRYSYDGTTDNFAVSAFRLLLYL